ncbi:MAG: HNH endonuclease [Sphingomonas sp.]|nr:HNH endonuclease [Sphingomonas sp.]
MNNIARRDDRSPDALSYRRHYKTARWQKLRWSILVRDMFTCQRCKRIVAGKGEAHCDHKTPHKGKDELFWNADNLIILCANCHNSAKQSEERTGKARPLIIIGTDGWPT